MFLDVSQLCVQYAGRTQRAVDQVSFSLQAGEIGVLIGPSGCGKTTLLRAVAGLERASAGSIRLAGDMVSSPQEHLPAEARRWRAQQKERAMYAAFMDALSHLMAGRFIRAAKLAQNAITQEKSLSQLARTSSDVSSYNAARATQLRLLAHLLAAESAQSLQNKALRERGGSLVPVESNPIDAVWQDQPAPSAAPAPTRVWISSMNRMMSPRVRISLSTFFRRSSKSPR